MLPRYLQFHKATTNKKKIVGPNLQVVRMDLSRPELDNTVNYLEADYFSSSFIVYTRPNKSLIVVISGADQHVYTTCIKVKHKRVVVDVESSVDVVYKLKESHLSRSQVAYKRKHLVHLNRLMENMLWTFTLITI